MKSIEEKMASTYKDFLEIKDVQRRAKMCDISEVSDANMDWEASIGKREESIAELNGRKHKMTILELNARLDVFIHKLNLHGYTWQNRSTTCEQHTDLKINPLGTGGSGSGHIKMEWGDKDGNKFSGGISGEIHDDKGNYAKIEVIQDNKGKGSAEVSAGHKEEK